MGFGMGNRLEGVLAPAAPKCTELMAVADRCALLGTIRVKDDIVGCVFAELSLSTHR